MQAGLSNSLAALGGALLNRNLRRLPKLSMSKQTSLAKLPNPGLKSQKVLSEGIASLEQLRKPGSIATFSGGLAGCLLRGDLPLRFCPPP